MLLAKLLFKGRTININLHSGSFHIKSINSPKACFISDVPHNTYVNLTDGNLTVFILPRSHARVIVGSVKSVYPLYLHQQTTCTSVYSE